MNILQIAMNERTKMTKDKQNEASLIALWELFNLIYKREGLTILYDLYVITVQQLSTSLAMPFCVCVFCAF